MQTQVRNVAVLMTCHNRREKTVRCLTTLQAQIQLGQLRVKTYVVDDGSSDGTTAAVKERFENATVLSGDGSLYWNGGMRRAVAAATAEGFDFYLWLNDDTVLYPDALTRLVSTFDQLVSRGTTAPIVVGSLCDPDTRRLTYGGSRQTSRLHPLRVESIVPSDIPQQCDVFNGNVVLVPKAVAHALGNLNRHFKHRAGDYEYGLRARRQGYSSWIAPGYFGECRRNPITGTWQDTALSRRVRIKKLLAPTGMPVQERLYFVARFGGPFWPMHFVSVYARFLVGLLKGAPSRRDRRCR